MGGVSPLISTCQGFCGSGRSRSIHSSSVVSTGMVLIRIIKGKPDSEKRRSFLWERDSLLIQQHSVPWLISPILAGCLIFVYRTDGNGTQEPSGSTAGSQLITLDRWDNHGTRRRSMEINKIDVSKWSWSRDGRARSGTVSTVQRTLRRTISIYCTTFWSSPSYDPYVVWSDLKHTGPWSGLRNALLWSRINGLLIGWSVTLLRWMNHYIWVDQPCE